MTEKISDAGEMHIENIWGKTIYTIFTKAWFYRGWYSYSVTKHCVLISGKCELIMAQKWRKDTIINMPLNTVIEIPANTPNIFKFLEDSVLLEWFEASAQKTDFPRYKAMKNK